MRKFNGKTLRVKLSVAAIGLAMGSGVAHAAISSLGADGWASVGVNNLGQTGTTGGQGALAVKTYTVRNRNQLIQALYGNTAVIKADGSFSGTLDTSKKVIYISGTISLSMNGALAELSADDYVAQTNAAGGSCASYGFATFSAWWNAYLDAYKPPYATVPSGVPESFRACAANQQKKIARITVPSNTSLIGVGSTAKIIHGNLMVSGTGASTPVDNVVIRNIAFEDAFDFFPQWDPTDSGGRWNSAYDNVSVQQATHVWIDHCTFSDGTRRDDQFPSVWPAPYDGPLYEVEHHDGLVDVTATANYVTLSNNHFHDHNKTSLIGGSDTASLTDNNPGVLKTTLHHNYYQNVTQRQPRVRYGMVHIYSNYYTGENGADYYGWSAGWASGQGSKIYAENNVFDITGNTAAVNKVITTSLSASKVTSCAALAGMSTAYCSAYIYDTGTVLNGVSVNASDSAHTQNALVTATATPWPSAASPTTTPSATPASYYNYNIGATTDLATSVPANAGVGKL
jgi:pectate lyase